MDIFMKDRMRHLFAFCLASAGPLRQPLMSMASTLYRRRGSGLHEAMATPTHKERHPDEALARVDFGVFALSLLCQCGASGAHRRSP